MKIKTCVFVCVFPCVFSIAMLNSSALFPLGLLPSVVSMRRKKNVSFYPSSFLTVTSFNKRKANTKSRGLLWCTGDGAQEETWMAQEGNQLCHETRYLFRTLRSSSCSRMRWGWKGCCKTERKAGVWKSWVITGLNSASKIMQYYISFLLTLSGLYWTRKSCSLSLVGN